MNVNLEIDCPIIRNGNIIVVIPTYNEIKNIALLVEGLFSLNVGLSILVVDDNSPDGTSEEVKKMQSMYSNLYLITRRSKLGLGSAYIEGFNYVLKNGYDIVIQMDADLSHAPSYLPEMLSLINEYDLVIGSRYIKNGGVLNWLLVRVILSRLANVFTKILLGLPFNDLTSGFKCIKTSVLGNIDYSSIVSKGYAFQIEMVSRTFLKGFKIIEYPILFQARKNEKSKMSMQIVLEAFIRVIILSKLRLIGVLKAFSAKKIEFTKIY